MPFLLWHFSPGDKIENCPAQFLAVCWIVHVEFKVHRLRDGFSVSNAPLLDAANSNTAKGFFTARPEAIKKTAQSWRVSGGLPAFAHEPAQTINTPEKPKQRPNLNKKNI